MGVLSDRPREGGEEDIAANATLAIDSDVEHATPSRILFADEEGKLSDDTLNMSRGTLLGGLIPYKLVGDAEYADEGGIVWLDLTGVGGAFNLNGWGLGEMSGFAVVKGLSGSTPEALLTVINDELGSLFGDPAVRVALGAAASNPAVDRSALVVYVDMTSGEQTIKLGDPNDGTNPVVLIDFNGNKLKNLADGTDAQDAVTKTQMETAIAAIPAGSGGGAVGPVLTSGYYLVPPGSPKANGTMTLSASTRCYFPLDISRDVTFDRFSLEVTTLAASTSIRCGLYEDSNGFPGARIIDAGAIDASTTGFKEITISQAVSAGRIWVALAVQGPNNVGVRAVDYHNTVGIPSSGWSVYEADGYKDNNALASGWPATADALSWADIYSATPRVFLRVV